MSQNLSFDPNYDLQLTYCPPRGQITQKNSEEFLFTQMFSGTKRTVGQLKVLIRKSCVFWDALVEGTIFSMISPVLILAGTSMWYILLFSSPEVH